MYFTNISKLQDKQAKALFHVMLQEIERLQDRVAELEKRQPRLEVIGKQVSTFKKA
ncbi:hypothetical protein [Paenibacillus oleatilyticus]|uniref:Uncharacterized protein n=1 Tax=Paenibacillus oleatilyticus TaxID=2594886 RepID=A0ABV4VCD4_9BACL